MNYQKHYDALIYKANVRILDKKIRVEKHHIIPRSLGGTNNASNLVNLTLREHYTAHHLLWKIYKNQQMTCAFWRMSHINKNNKLVRINSITYETIREEIALLTSLRMKTPEMVEYYKQFAENRAIGVRAYMKETRKGKTWEEIYGKEIAEKMRGDISNANKGKVLTQSHKENIRKGNTGKLLTNETKNKISAANTGKIRTAETKKRLSESHLGKTISDEHKRKISESTIGKNKTEETKKKMSDAKKGKIFSDEHKKKLSDAAKSRTKK